MASFLLGQYREYELHVEQIPLGQYLCVQYYGPGNIVGAGPTTRRTTKSSGVWQAIKAVGGSLRHLPLYSPELNPIEKIALHSKRHCTRLRQERLTHSGAGLAAFLVAFPHRSTAPISLHQSMGMNKSKTLPNRGLITY